MPRPGTAPATVACVAISLTYVPTSSGPRCRRIVRHASLTRSASIAFSAAAHTPPVMHTHPVPLISRLYKVACGHYQKKAVRPLPGSSLAAINSRRKYPFPRHHRHIPTVRLPIIVSISTAAEMPRGQIARGTTQPSPVTVCRPVFDRSAPRLPATNSPMFDSVVSAILAKRFAGQERLMGRDDHVVESHQSSQHVVRQHLVRTCRERRCPPLLRRRPARPTDLSVFQALRSVPSYRPDRHDSC